MSEILLRMNPETGNVEKIQLIADDKDSQLDGIDRLRLLLKDIHQFSEHTARSILLYNLFKGESDDGVNGR